MSPKRILAVAVYLSVFAAGRGVALPAEPAAAGSTAPGTDVEPAPAKLVFTYPCTFAYADGKPYEARVMDFECDYLHASVKNAAKSFADLPSLAAQKAFLDDALPRADTAHNEYIKKIAELIQKTDPAKVPKDLPSTKRMDRIAALNVELSTGVFEIAKPFLWPAREEQSYVQKTAGSWPASWKPYIQPIYDRSGQLSGLVHDSEMKLIDRASADLEKKLAAATKAAAAVKGPGAGGALNLMFDGGAARDGVAVPMPASDPRKARPAAGGVEISIPVPVSDLKTPVPPIPKTEDARQQRNYFSRGTAAGLQRLKDDAAVATWHALGQSVTVGDPYGNAPLIFHQKGPSCDVSSQAEALRSRGQTVDLSKLAKEGLEKGYYVDYAMASGHREGGTPWEHVDSLLQDHGVAAKNVNDATPAQLDQAIRASGDAIVFVRVKTFWKDDKVPPGASHAVYVTGEEVGADGKVRGYYVNDTGTGEAARFVSADVFKRSWLNVFVALPPHK